MRKRTQCKKNSTPTNQYDPQIGAAAQANTAVAERAQQFSEDYYNNTVAPLLQQTVAASTESQAKLNKLYEMNYEQAKAASDRYTATGIPAEDAYYNKVKDFSSDNYQEEQARAAKGDLQTAQASQEQQVMRQYGAMGIDPTSPAAIAARSDRAVVNAAAEASAQNRARNAAKTLGLQLTADAANFGRGGQSGVLQFGAGASGNATGAYGVAQGALGAATSAGTAQQAGYQTALQGYGQNSSMYTSLGNTSINAQASQNAAISGGIGSALGVAGGLAAGKFW